MTGGLWSPERRALTVGLVLTITLVALTFAAGLPPSARATFAALRFAIAAAAAERSTRVTAAAPRLADSSPSAPEPANRSRTAASRIESDDSSALNSDSRTRSLVGRVPLAGTSRVSEPARPEMMRVTRQR